MVVGELPEQVDLLVVGGGPGGYVAALEAARLGRNVVLVDSAGEAGLGGVCVNVGCIPSKALIELAHVAHDSSEWTSRGLTLAGPSAVDMPAFQQWKVQVVGSLNGGVRQLLSGAGVDVRTGYFRFTRKDQGALDLGTQAQPVHLKFKSCILATGSRPASLSALKRDGVRILDSTDVLALTALPERIVVVGGGYIGIELGTALAKCGTKVTIVDVAPRILAALPSLAVSPVAKRLAQLGVEVLTETSVVRDDGTALHVLSPEGEKTLECDAVVVVAGRVPNTDDLGLEVLGVTPDERGLLEVGTDLRIAPDVAAIGDITPGPALAHRASAQAHVAAAVLSGHDAHFDPMAIPAVVFSDPEIALTGLTQEQAIAQGLEVETSTFPLAASGRARTMAATAGSYSLVHTNEGVIVGGFVVGAHASELIGEITLAIEMGAHLHDVAHTIHPHPTMSESIVEAAYIGLGTPVHVAPKRKR